jgi:hypothetical protein
MIEVCHYCRTEVDTDEDAHTAIDDYPVAGESAPSIFCNSCVDPEAAPAVQAEQVKRLFILLITCDDLDAPRVAPGNA